MSESKKFCKHSDGLGYCDILSDNETRQYCVEGPCPHEELVEYVPVVHAKWIVKDEGIFRNVKCSACGEDYPAHYGMLQIQNFGYCLNCGARMDGEG